MKIPKLASIDAAADFLISLSERVAVGHRALEAVSAWSTVGYGHIALQCDYRPSGSGHHPAGAVDAKAGRQVLAQGKLRHVFGKGGRIRTRSAAYNCTRCRQPLTAYMQAMGCSRWWCQVL